MPGKSTYSAGTAFLTVVPSFLGIEKAFKEQVRDMAAAADKDLAAGMAKGLDDINKQAKDRGSKAGRDYAGAYESEAKKALTKAWQSLPEPKPDVDLSKWEKELGKVRQGMKELSAQRIGIDIDKETFDRAINDFAKELERLRGTASGKNKEINFFDADQAAKQLREFQAFTDDIERRAGAAGDTAGSVFGQKMSTALRSGLAKTPEIKITADSSEAERTLAALRVRMEELQSKRIGIDIDAATAYAELKAIKGELDKLDRRSVSAEIRTNARAVSADLGQVVTAAEGASKSTEGIGSSANFSLSRLEALILLGASLGTVLVPAAAAAAGAVGTIGTMAIAAGTGIGVFALALSGVSAAVKALNNYSNATAKSTKSFDDANRAAASSADQLRSAEASLANTRRTVAEAAADAARRVADAERGVADARREAALAARNAAREVADARASEKNAEQDLADAKRQAIIDEADADRQVRDAQRSVTQAEQDALDVRKALTQAINDAKDSMMELDAQIARNTQDQSVAVTAQMKALEELNKLKTNPRATEIEIRQAQDAYNEQTVRLQELGVQQKELAEKKAKYDKDGVEADDKVIAARKRIQDADQALAAARERLAREEEQRRQTDYKAQQRIADAQQRVAKAQETVARALESQHETEIKSQEQIAKAQQAVADARRQQTRQALDGQFQLAQASQGVTAAQRAQAAAWDKTAVAGGSALDTLNAKMSQLSPAQQHFAKFIFGLKDDLTQLQQAAAEPLLPQLETAITGLLKYLPNVEAFISKVAGTLGNIAVQAVNAFGNPVWQKFFGYINQTAAPSLQNMYTIAQNFAQGLIDIFLALTPFNQDVGGGLIKLSQDFAVWAEKLDKTQGYRDFLAYVKENGPKVVHFLGQVGQLFINIVQASAPMGSITLKLLTDFVGILNSLPEPVLTFLVTTIGLLSLGLSGLGAVMRGVKFKEQITEIFGPKAQSLVQKFAIDTGRATEETGKFGKVAFTVDGIAASARDKVFGYGRAIAGLPGQAKAAITSSGLFTRAMDGVRGGASAVVGAVKAAGDAVQNIGPRLSGLAGTAKTTATTGLDRLKNSMLEVVTASTGAGGVAAGVQVAGEKLSGFASAAADAGSKLGGKIKEGASNFAGALGNVASKAGSAATSITSKLMKAGGSLIGMLGGPWGIALTGAVVALDYFSEKSAQQKQKVDTLKNALGELSTTYRDLALTGDQAGAAADQAFANVVKQNPELQKAVIELDHLGVSFGDMVKAAASGDPSAVIAKLNDEINKNIALSQQWISTHFRKEDPSNNPYQKEVKNLQALRDAFVQNAQAMGLASQATEILNADTDRNQAITVLQGQVVDGNVGKQLDMLNAYDRNAASIDALNKLIGTYSNLQSTAQQRADAVRQAIENQTGAAIAQTDADEALAQKTMALKDQVNQAKDAHDKNAKSLDLNSTTALRNRDALEEVAKQIREMYLQDIAAGKPIADVTKAHDNRIAALKEEAKHLGLDKKATQDLIDKYGDVPKDIKTYVSMDPNSFKNVYQNLQKVQFMQQMLKMGVNADEAEKGWQQSQSDMNRAIAHGYATGGKMVGPGTGTSDSMVVRVSNGEWVHKTAAVDYYGDAAMSAINNMQVPRENLAGYSGGGKIPRQRRPQEEDLPGYATGGKVLKVPMRTNISKTWVPTAEWVRAHTPTPEGDWAGVLSPNETAAKMQKFALAQRGKRYLWAAVGPDRYDCSGLTGDLWAIATGHKLYRRYMSTSDMGPGRHGMVAGPGKYWTVYLGPGHTASNISGLHAEAYGGNGTPLAIGHVGTRLSYYTQKLHLPGFAEGGAVDPADLKTKKDRMISFLRYGWPEPPMGAGFDALLDSPMIASQYDGGGMLPPGYSTVVNNTGAPEPVLTSQQWNDISAIAAGGRARGGNTYQFSFLDTTLNEQKLREIQDREAITARYDRAH